MKIAATLLVIGTALVAAPAVGHAPAGPAHATHGREGTRTSPRRLHRAPVLPAGRRPRPPAAYTPKMKGG